MSNKQSLRGKVSRLAGRLRDAEWRRYGALLFAGKLTGICLLMGAFVLMNPDLIGMSAMAADPVVKANDIVNPINTLWTLVAAFLVFGMQVGFTMLEAGFCRSRETVNVLMECIVDTCLCGLLFYAWGFAFMFSHGNGFIGLNWFFLQGASATYESSGVAFLAFWLFQFAFADTCSTITSGAMIGRTGWIGDLVYSFCVSGFIYPIIGHWAWGPTDSSRPWAARVTFFRGWAQASMTSPVRLLYTRSAGSLRSPDPSFSGHASAVSSNATGAGQCCRTT